MSRLLPLVVIQTLKMVLNQLVAALKFSEGVIYRIRSPRLVPNTHSKSFVY